MLAQDVHTAAPDSSEHAIVRAAGAIVAARTERAVADRLGAALRELGCSGVSVELGAGESGRGDLAIRGLSGAMIGRARIGDPGPDAEALRLVADIAARTIEAIRRREGQRLELLGRLAEGVAHDYNNMLTVIQGQAELAQRGLSGPARDAVSSVEMAAQQASDIVASLLECTRPAAAEREPIDLGGLIEQMVPLLERITPAAVGVTFDNSAPGIMASIAPTRFRQLLINLVLNARDAIEGRGAIAISLVQIRESRIRLSVRDSGSGIAPEALPRVFDRDYSSRGGGFGLGLAIVRDIVDEHGGEIAIESEPGRGTTVSIDLPRSEAPLQRAG